MDQLTAENIPRRSTHPRESASTLLMMFFAAAATLASLLTMLALVFAGPHFELIFVDFDTELPRLTVLFIEYRVPFAVAAAALAAAPIIIVFTMPRAPGRLTLVAVCLLVSLIFLMTFVMSLFLPWVSLIQSVSQ